ncbi:MAG: hypothetical protein CMF46_01695 [Legionellales bacterium]|nr:hypothetical protein [Legionellales bacterium]
MPYLLTNTELSRSLTQLNTQSHKMTLSLAKRVHIVQVNQWIIESYLADKPNAFVISSLESWLLWLELALTHPVSASTTDQSEAIEHLTHLFNVNQSVIRHIDPQTDSKYQQTDYGHIYRIYLSHCQENQLIDLTMIASQLRQGTVRPLKTDVRVLCHSNIDRLPFDRWAGYELIDPMNQQQRHCLTDNETDELNALVDWCHQHASQSQWPMTIVAPDEPTVIQAITAHLCANLRPGLTLSDWSEDSHRYRLVTRATLAFLSLHHESTIDDLLILLQSKHLNLSLPQSDIDHLAALRTRMTTLKDAYSFIEYQAHLDELKLLLKRIISLCQISGSAHRINQWAHHFKQQLVQIDWHQSTPAAYSKRFDELLEQLIKQQHLFAEINQATAITMIHSRLSQMVFYPVDKTAQRLHLISAKQAIHCRLHHVWVYGCHQYFYPACLNRKQAELGYLNIQTPTATENQQALMDHLCRHTHDVTFSSCRQYQGQAVEPIPLIVSCQPVDRYEQSDQPVKPWLPTGIHCQKDLPHISGHQLLLDQSHCAYKAYARHQLRIQKTQNKSANFSIDALEKGRFVHSILQQFWSVTHDHATLISRSIDQEALLLDRLIGRQLQHYTKQLKINDHILVEHNRVKQLIQKWLLLEKEREPFSILRLEHPIELSIRTLPIKLVIDRIDRLRDGSLFIIDYKTYPAKRAVWLADRLPDLQLQLYALACRSLGDISGLAFAHLHHTGCQWTGLSTQSADHGLIQPSQIGSGKETFEELFNHWQRYCESMVTEYLQGGIEAKPYFHDSCHYCEYQSTCGILDGDD